MTSCVIMTAIFLMLPANGQKGPGVHMRLRYVGWCVQSRCYLLPATVAQLRQSDKARSQRDRVILGGSSRLGPVGCSWAGKAC